ncbi:MAG: ATP-binding protein [Clostridia bacterium]|nr:ATP-binding protein [Clostridia bacterium]
MNVTAEIRKNPFPPGFYVITGEQGAGKTSLATAFLCTDAKRWARERWKKAQEIAREYYNANDIRLKIDEYLYFSNIDISLTKQQQKTHYVDLPRFALPNPNFAVQYFPNSSVIFIQEADLLLFCRDWQNTNAFLIDFLKYVRHFNLTVFFDMQDIDNLDAAVRRLVMGIFHVRYSYTARYFLFWKQRRWKFTYINNQLNNLMKDVADVKKPLKVVRNGRFRFVGDIFKRYESFSGKWYFLWGIEKKGYEYLKHPKASYKIKEINEFIKAHPLTKPDEMKQSSGKDNDKGGKK